MIVPLARLPTSCHVALSRIAWHLENVHLMSFLKAELYESDHDRFDEEVREAMTGSEILADLGVRLAHPGKEERVRGDGGNINFA